jgi:hypothetical protein
MGGCEGIVRARSTDVVLAVVHVIGVEGQRLGVRGWCVVVLYIRRMSSMECIVWLTI